MGKIENIQDTQMMLLACLCYQPILFKRLTVKAEQLTKPFDKYLKLMLKSYELYKTVNLDYMQEHLDLDDYFIFADLFTKEVWGLFNKSHFDGVQKRIHERTIDMNLDKYVSAYQQEKITLDDLKNFLNIPINSEYESLTSDLFVEVLEKAQRNLFFAGFQNLRAIGNFKETDLTVIAAYTGKGKSALALNLLEDLSRNYECYYINLEMSVSQLKMRMISIHTGINISDLERFKYLSKETQEKIKSKVKFIDERKITLVNDSQSIESLRNIIASNNNEHKIYFIDHIGLLKVKGNNLYEKMTLIAKELRSICLDYNATIFALSQVSRSGAKGKLDLSMLRDSGELEQSASKVILMYSEEVIQGEQYYLEVAKNRDGNIGRIPIKFDKSTQIIRDL